MPNSVITTNNNNATAILKMRCHHSKKNSLLINRSSPRTPPPPPPPSWSTSKPAAFVLFTLGCLCLIHQHQVESSSLSEAANLLSSDHTLLVGGQQPLTYSNLHQPSYSFDPSAYKSIGEAIRGHPELREFAALCELEGVKEIVSMDRTPLTLFAPIDKSMGDLLAKSKSRNSINLIELAKHHIVQGFVMPDESTKYPLQFASYSLLSPLYLNQVQLRGPAGPTVFVNNAKILATHLIPIDSDNYQTLHIIDQVLEYAYVNRRAQLRGPASVGGSSGAAGANRKSTTVRRSLSLDDLLPLPANEQQQQPAYEFYERFGDLHASQAQVDLYHTRAYRATDMQNRLALGRDELNFERLARSLRQQPELRGKLYQVNESSSMNTYFLPMNTQELDALLSGSENAEPGWFRLALEAHIVPDQVLFTRVMGLGQPHSSLFDRDSHSHRVALSLAKSLPPAIDPFASSDDQPTGGSLDQNQDTGSRSLLATPLLLQATCSPLQHATSGARGEQDSPASSMWRSGLTNSEVLVANIPLSNGVLHIIKKPILIVTETTNVLDYLNDHDNQLSNVVSALGSRSAPIREEASLRQPAQQVVAVARVNRFRELLARERQMLATFSMDAQANKTILAPSDQAFQRLRFDLRALVQGDESLIPRHWDASYRHDLLERLVKRHVILHQTITSDMMLQPSGYQALSDNGKVLNFGPTTGSGTTQDSEQQLQVECDNVQAKLLHRDLIGTNGVLHIIDRVLGEEQETVYSLLKSILVRHRNQLEESQTNENELSQLIQTNIKNQSTQPEMISTASSSQQQNSIVDSSQAEQPANQLHPHNRKQQETSPELALISKSIGQYLDELSNRHQLQQQLATSVNISYQLAKLTSMAEGQDDWNDKFKLIDRQFTYFVPSDLAWIRLQQAQPELYKPLMYFLDQQQQQNQNNNDLKQQSPAEDQQQSPGSPPSQDNNRLIQLDTTSGKSPRSSQSSHRLRQILERHLVVNKKIAKKDLSQLESLQTIGATLRLVDAPQQQQLTAQTALLDGASAQGRPASAYAALHSIISGQQQGSSYQVGAQPGKSRSLRFESSSANIVQSMEASNGFVHIIDNVLLLPEDSDYIVQTSSAPAISSTMSSLLGGHNSALLDFVQSLLAPSPFNMSAQSILVLMGTLLLAIALLVVLATVLIVRRRRQNKLTRHQQLESGLTSSSSANSGSTSTTKSL